MKKTISAYPALVLTPLLLLASVSYGQSTNRPSSSARRATIAAPILGKVTLFEPEVYRTLFPETLSVTSVGGATSFADFEGSADGQAFSMRAYGSNFTTFSHAGVTLKNMAEVWADQFTANGNAGLLIGTGYGYSNIPSLPGPPIIFATGNVERMRLDANGRLTINYATPPSTTDPYLLDVNGPIRGTYISGSSFQDFAEWVPATESMAPGTVVVLNLSKKNEVRPSVSAYDTSVAGVVSERPGIVLGDPASNKAQIATTGRVKVRVDATSNPIRVGDILVTSDVPGTAMRSVPLDLGGVPIHRPGTIIGKALEPLSTGKGEILVLLSLQ